MKRIIKFNTKKLNETFNINTTSEIIYEEYEGNCGYEGKLNPFYGKKHSEETKELFLGRKLNHLEWKLAKWL